MSGFEFDVSELNALAADLSAAPGRVQGGASDAVRKTLRHIETDARSTAPVLTGRLRGSIHAESNGALSGSVSAGVEYAKYVEYGTSKMSAEPFMGPAFDRQAPGLGDALGDAGEEAVL